MLDQEQEPRSGGIGKALVIGAVVVAALGAAIYVIGPMLRPAPKPADPAPAPKAAKAEPRVEPKAVEPAPEPEPARPTKPRPKKEKTAAPAPPPPEAPSGPTLIIESDVPGASVFVDRQYVGVTPLKTTAVTAGKHQLNASADGEDGLAQSIDVDAAGETTVTLKFKEVRLDVSVAVVHKHGVGSCDGKLLGSPAGLRYDTSNGKDGFTLAYKDVEVFEIDYLKKELKVKQRGGKTWNFTDRNDNADKLFIFHRDVTKARGKLAAQGK